MAPRSGGMAAAEPVATRTINRDWTFNYLPAKTEDLAISREDYDDAAWTAVALPHTWMTYETTRELHPFIRNASETDDPYWWHGWGYYRKRFAIDARHRGKKVFVEFDGVQKYCRAYLNGEFVGEHKGGFTSFSLDLTDKIRFGENNLLTLAVGNRRDDNFGHIPPMQAGNWNLYGGIYRDVRLVVKQRLYIPFQGAADHEGGTFVTTPEVSAERAKVRVLTYVKNDGEAERTCLLRTAIVDGEGRVIARMETASPIKPGELHQFDQTSQNIARPCLWSPEAPCLYRVLTEVHDERGKVADRHESPLGFRWFHWNAAENHLYLNDKKTHLHGQNRHQEYAWLGDAIPKWMHERDLRDIRLNLGHNFMRTAHYPQDPMVYDLADRLGILICEEAPNIKALDFGEDVQEQNMRELIRRDRNHPSIVMWSMGNETTDAADSAWAKEEDPARLIHARHVRNDSAGRFVDFTDKNYEMENLLQCTVRGWYGDDEKPLRPLDVQQTGNEAWQHRQQAEKMPGIRGRDPGEFLDVNGAIWIYNDHGADREYSSAPLKHVNPKGWVDVYRQPKYIYYLYQAFWGERPMVWIMPHFWRGQYLSRPHDIVVDSNCEEVELKVNGASLGVQRPSREHFNIVTFNNVLIRQGTLTAEGRNEGKVAATCSVAMAGAPARVVLSSEPTTIQAGWGNVAIVKADVVDKDGHHIFGANPDLTWKAAGPATLVGPACYRSDTAKCEEMEGAWYIDTPVCNVVRSTGDAGAIEVRVSAPGLEPGRLTIEAAAPPAEPDDGIVQPVLAREGRRPVTTNPRMADGGAARAAGVAPAGLLAPVRGELKFEGRTTADYTAAIDAFIRRNNPAVDASSPGYQALVARFGERLTKSGGELIADDYNFAIGAYNDSVALPAAVERDPPAPGVKARLKEE